MNDQIQMTDFSSDFWHWFIVIPTVVGIIWCALLAWHNSKGPKTMSEETMGHVWDEDLQEYNNPLPRWWLNMFYLTIIFGLVYLILYPGLGKFKGVLDWTQRGQYNQEIELADARYAPLYDKYASMTFEQLAQDSEAMKTAGRLFSTNCALCHGSDARGARGFPNLTDDDWLYGNDQATILQTLTNGRNGVMPGWEQVLGEDGAWAVAEYVLSLSRDPVNPDLLEKGKQQYDQLCVACHGANGKGNQALGAPNLTDDIWLYGGSHKAVVKSLIEGRNGVMPAQKDLLTEEQIHLLGAYVTSLSNSAKQ